MNDAISSTRGATSTDTRTSASRGFEHRNDRVRDAIKPEYEHWSTYGSPEIDSRLVAVENVTVSDDRKRVSLVTGKRNTGKAFQIWLRGKVLSVDGETPITQEAFYTLLAIP